MLTPSASRMSLHRERRKRGLRCLTIEVRSTEITELVRRGLLSQSEEDDSEAIKLALYRHLDKTLKQAI